MDKLIESMSNINVRKNDGYLFIKRDEIYVPIMKTILSITKRSFYSLPLLDEIVLRLINEGIQEIDELVNILGIDRKLLEVTLADLSVKDVIYCTTNRCSLLAKEYSKGIYVKFKPEEVEILHDRMKEAGVQNMSAYIRKMALNGYVIIPKWPDLNRVISLQARISNNLNQYVKKANETGKLYEEDKTVVQGII